MARATELDDLHGTPQICSHGHCISGVLVSMAVDSHLLFHSPEKPGHSVLRPAGMKEREFQPLVEVTRRWRWQTTLNELTT